MPVCDVPLSYYFSKAHIFNKNDIYHGDKKKKSGARLKSIVRKKKFHHN